MRFDELVELVGSEGVFEPALLFAGDRNPGEVRRQISRWTRAGRVLQIRRGLYALPAAFRKGAVHPFVVANRMVKGSYVSCQSALAHHGLIPEHVPVVTSVTTGRPGSWDTPLGGYEFRHVNRAMFSGYMRVDLGGGQEAFVAPPEKAILDLVHLEPGGDRPEYLEGLRLQNLEKLDVQELDRLAASSRRPKLERAVGSIALLARHEKEEYVAV